RIDRARAYIELGLRILQKSRARKPIYYRRWVCRKCRTPLVPGATSRVRVRGTRSYLVVVKKCLICGWINRTAASRKRVSNLR
ncbi:MAG: ribonuclease P, partial [Sulfolobales archaeon]|nr:ribonuclease P [Sulfolobales archaeon]